MPKRPAEPDRAFYDVFISYRHRDEARIAELENRIRNAGFEPFRDLNFPVLGDPSDVTREKIESIRQQLSRSTCLVFAYSHASAVRDRKPGASLGVWMPWELGFFDGAISSRIGVFLLDGPRGEIEPKTYFRGSEYLQLYDELTSDNLEAFLRRNAVRERRIDNVGSAFVWLEHLFRECVANPTNVNLGVAEWFADHASRFWRENGNPTLADAFAQMKVMLDDARVTAAPALRLPMFDELGNASLNPGRSGGAVRGAATPQVTLAPQGAPPPPGSDMQAAQRLLQDAWGPLLAAWQQAARGLSSADWIAAIDPLGKTDDTSFR